MTVRAAVVEDAEAIAHVQTRTWQVAYRGVLSDEFLDGMDWRRRIEHWRHIVDVGRVFVVLAEDRVVGFIAMGPGNETDGYELYAIYVQREFWGSGLADELVAELPDEPTVLWVLADNPRARRFYERHGFKPDGESKIETIGGRAVEEVRYARVSRGTVVT